MNRRSAVLILLSLSLFMVAASIKSGWLYLVSSALVSMVMAGLISGWRSTRHVEVLRECPQEAFEGEGFPVRLRAVNTGRFSRYMITVTDSPFTGRKRAGLLGKVRSVYAGWRAVYSGRGADPGTHVWAGGREAEEARAAEVAIERLAPGEPVEASYRMAAPRRGVYEGSRLVVSGEGVLGTARIRRAVDAPSRITIFPKVHPVEDFPAGRRSTVLPAESYEWSRRGMGQDYYGVREYTRGDPLRHIHWKSSARHGDLIVREYQQEFRPATAMAVLLRSPVLGDANVNSLEDGLRAAASILGYCAALGSPPNLVVPRDGAFVALEQDTLYGCLYALAAYEADDGAGPGDALDFSRRSFGAGCPLVLVTNIPLREAAPALGGLHGVEELALVFVVEDSYGGAARAPRAEEEVEAVRDFAYGTPVSVYAITGGSDIGRCLSEPLKATVP